MRLAVTLPLSVIAGLVTGFAIFREPRRPAASIAQLVQADTKKEESASQPNEPATSEAKIGRLVEAVRIKVPHERESGMYLAIEALSAEDLRRLMNDGAALKDLIKKMEGMEWQTGGFLMSGLISRWLELDREAATAWASRALDVFSKKESGAHNWILEALAVKLPEQMLAVVPSRQDPIVRKDIIKHAVRKLAMRDSAKAREWIASCTDSEDRRVAESAFRLGIVATDPLRAVELARSISNRGDATNVLASAANFAARTGPGILRQLANLPMEPWMKTTIIGKVGERDPSFAMELALQERGEGGDASDALSAAFSAMAERDPQECLAELEGLDGVERGAAVSAIGSAWASHDPAAALAWLMEQPLSERSYSEAGYSFRNDTLVEGFSDWMDGAPSVARAWADALPAGTTRDKLQAEIARSLATRGESAEAARILMSLGKSADQRTISEVVGAWARRDPQAAAEWALSQEAGSTQSRALAGIVGTWANDDQEGIENWLSQFPSGEARDLSVKAFLWRSNAWTSGREQRIAEFDRWFDLIDDPWQRALAARSNFFQRKSQDPEGARAWLSSLKNVDPELIRTTLRDNGN